MRRTLPITKKVKISSTIHVHCYNGCMVNNNNNMAPVQEDNMVIDVEKSEEEKRKEGLTKVLDQSRLDIQVRILILIFLSHELELLNSP